MFATYVVGSVCPKADLLVIYIITTNCRRLALQKSFISKIQIINIISCY